MKKRFTLFQLIVNGVYGLDGLIAIQYAAKESSQGAGNLFGRHKTMESDVKYATELIIKFVLTYRVHSQQLSRRQPFLSYRMLLRIC